ncbi:MAG: glutathione peroxidase [Chitinophagaceae bacterium]|nr:glutathione peroxidase [Chitinophagaceae bacterium]
MTFRQKLLKGIYPVLMWLTGKKGGKMTEVLKGNLPAPVSFYSLKAELNNGSVMDFATLRGKQVLLVNTASNCGYTHQYKALQELYEKHQPGLVVIGFPANDFKEQEKGTDEEIASFCQVNYGVKFPLVKKASVIPGESQQVIFKWLTDASQNGWNGQSPTWNFSKYLVDENGSLIRYFGPSVDPLSDEVKEAIKP